MVGLATRIEPVTSLSYPSEARRLGHSSLDTGWLKIDFRVFLLFVKGIFERLSGQDRVHEKLTENP